MTISFDKKLAELDAYLQMLIDQNEQLDKRLCLLSQNEAEKESLLVIKENLETLLGSIKHAIVLLQIAKVSVSNPSPPETPKAPERRKKFTSSPSSSGSGKSPSVGSNSIAAAITASLQDQQRQFPRYGGPNSRARDASARGADGGATVAKEGLSVDSIGASDCTTASAAATTAVGGSGASGAGGHSVARYSNSGVANNAALAAGAAAAVAADGDGCGGVVDVGNATSVAVAVYDEHDGEDDDDDDAFYDAADDQQSSSSKLHASQLSAPHSQLDSASKYYSDQQSPTTTTTTRLDNTFISNMPDSAATSNNNNNNTAIGSTQQHESIDWDGLYDEDEEDLGSLDTQGSVIKHLMSQIRIGMDLTKVVLPTFILERRSLLEMYADFFAHPDLFSSIPEQETPEERMVQLVKWYLSAFHAGRKSSVAKKPYNPILGEIFLCHWTLNPSDDSAPSKPSDADVQTTSFKSSSHEQSSNSDGGSSDGIESFQSQLAPNSLMFVAEQVSHHPPVSAFYAENAEKSISCCAHIYTKSKYLGLSVGVHNIGQGVINLLNHNETYTCTFPSGYGRSILTVPWIELGGSVNIVCQQTGYTANIEFVTKPFYGGKKHRVIGEILRPNKEPIMSIDGEWNGVIYSKSPPNSDDKHIFVDTTCLPVIKKQVRPIKLQESYESRNVWKEVTRALKLHDVTSATAAKSFIEQRQRDLLKERLEKGIRWKSRYFEAVDDGWTYGKPLSKYHMVSIQDLDIRRTIWFS